MYMYMVQVHTVHGHVLTCPRDDLTVQVIFFGDGPKTGEVTINLDATAETAEPKPKL